MVRWCGRRYFGKALKMADDEINARHLKDFVLDGIGR